MTNRPYRKPGDPREASAETNTNHQHERHGIQWREWTRILACWGTVWGLAIDAALTVARVGALPNLPGVPGIGGPTGPAVTQVMQVYVEGMFWAVIAVGMGMGLYIGSRQND